MQFTNELPEDFINDVEITSLINEHRDIIFVHHQSNEKINEIWIKNHFKTAVKYLYVLSKTDFKERPIKKFSIAPIAKVKAYSLDIKLTDVYWILRNLISIYEKRDSIEDPSALFNMVFQNIYELERGRWNFFGTTKTDGVSTIVRFKKKKTTTKSIASVCKPCGPVKKTKTKNKQCGDRNRSR